MKKRIIVLIVSFLALGGAISLKAYPIDGYPYTFIRRLVYEYRNYTDEARHTKLKAGALASTEEIQLSLKDNDMSVEEMMKRDDQLQSKVNALFRGLHPNYSLSVIDITEGKESRFASHRPEAGYQPGSVGKLAVLLGFFTELDRLYDDDWEAKRALMVSHFVWSGDWGLPNHHTVPFYDIQSDKLVKRYVQAEDNFSLYEWLDHMLSVSSNAAATIVWREALYMRIMGDQYECAAKHDIDAMINSIGKDSLSAIANAIVNNPLRQLGISEDEWRLGSFFTNGADRHVRPIGGSIGTTDGLMKFLLALEKGDLVDERSSLEMKRLLYITDRRIRYAYSPALNDDRVYFKSGSLYKCRKDGSPCGKYKGNVYNYMNSVAIVEKDDCTYYIVVLMSNVPEKNSANDHQALAARIDKLVRET